MQENSFAACRSKECCSGSFDGAYDIVDARARALGMGIDWQPLKNPTAKPLYRAVNRDRKHSSTLILDSVAISVHLAHSFLTLTCHLWEPKMTVIFIFTAIGTDFYSQFLSSLIK